MFRIGEGFYGVEIKQHEKDNFELDEDQKVRQTDNQEINGKEGDNQAEGEAVCDEDDEYEGRWGDYNLDFVGGMYPSFHQ